MWFFSLPLALPRTHVPSLHCRAVPGYPTSLTSQPIIFLTNIYNHRGITHTHTQKETAWLELSSVNGFEIIAGLWDAVSTRLTDLGKEVIIQRAKIIHATDKCPVYVPLHSALCLLQTDGWGARRGPRGMCISAWSSSGNQKSRFSRSLSVISNLHLQAPSLILCCFWPPQGQSSLPPQTLILQPS